MLTLYDELIIFFALTVHILKSGVHLLHCAPSSLCSSGKVTSLSSGLLSEKIT